MHYNEIQKIEDAYEYFTECAIANLDFFMNKSKCPSKLELERHIEICERMIRQGKYYGLDMNELDSYFQESLKYLITGNIKKAS